MPVFDILASVVKTPAGDFLVRVTVAARQASAWRNKNKVDELRFPTQENAESGRDRMIAEAIGRLRRDGDELGAVIGTDWDGPDRTVVPR